MGENSETMHFCHFRNKIPKKNSKKIQKNYIIPRQRERRSIVHYRQRLFRGG